MDGLPLIGSEKEIVEMRVNSPRHLGLSNQNKKRKISYVACVVKSLGSTSFLVQDKIAPLLPHVIIALSFQENFPPYFLFNQTLSFNSLSREINMRGTGIFSVVLCLVIFPRFLSGNSDPRLAPALYVLGDSLLDSGNNNFLPTLARADFQPYGVNFPGGATGRFTNGRTVADFIGMSRGPKSVISVFRFFVVFSYIINNT